MSLADFNIDASSLVLIQTGFAFLTAPFTSPTYNFPLFLFGFYATEKTDSNEPMRLFSVLLGVSFFFDFIWLLKIEHHGIVGAFVVINMLIKIPTFLSVALALRHRGYSLGPLGRSDSGSVGGAGETVWSMPGAFNTGPKPGYQNIDDDLEAPAPPGRLNTAHLPGPSAHSHQAQVQKPQAPSPRPEA